jgi:hypothetical protein
MCARVTGGTYSTGATTASVTYRGRNAAAAVEMNL